MATTFLNGSPRASVRSLGKPAAAFPASVAGDAQLAIAVNREQTKLALPLAATDTSMTVQSLGGIVIWSLLSIEDEIVQVNNPPSGNTVPISRGFDGTTPALHLAGTVVAGLIDAYHHNTLVAEVEAIETALGANLSKIPTAPTVNSASFNFPPQSPGGALIVGANSITLAPVPAGVNGTDAGHYLYVYGTGTPEAAPIIGGSGAAGSPSGQIIIQCANPHPAGWSIKSATSGIQEAISSLMPAGGQGVVQLPVGYSSIWGPILVPTNGLTLRGMGVQATVLNPQYPNMNVITVQSTNNTDIVGNLIQDLTIYDNLTTAATPLVYLVVIYHSDLTMIERVQLKGGAGGIHNTGIGSNYTYAPGGAHTYLHDVFLGDQLNTMFLNDKGSGFFMDMCTFGASTQPSTGGMVIQDGGGYFSNCDFYQCKVGLLIAPGASQRVSNCFITQSSFDSGSGAGIYIQPATGGLVQSIACANAWSATNALGIYLDATNGKVDGFNFTGGRIWNNQQGGVQIVGAAANLVAIRFHDNDIAVNSMAGANTYPNVHIGPNVGDISLVGNRIGSPYSGMTNACTAGILVDAGSGDYLMMRENTFIGDTSPIFFGATGIHNRLGDNIGIDTLMNSSIASAASVSLGTDGKSIFTITGTTAITTINGGRVGVRYTFVKADTGTVTIGGGGNVPGTHTLAQNQNVSLVFDGATWY